MNRKSSLSYYENEKKYVDDKLTNYKKVYETCKDSMTHDISVLFDVILNHFDYYSKSVVNEILAELYRNSLSCGKISPDSTVFCAISSDNGNINSSYEYVCEFRNINSISKYVVYPDFFRIIEKIDCFDTVVFIDDFCGTGDTFIRFISNYVDLLIGKSIKYLVIHFMLEAEEKIQKYANEKSINIETISYFKCGAAFKIPELKQYEERFVLESNRRKIPSDKIYGYKETQGLVAFYNNTPNNTLGIFWYNNDLNQALFPRNREENHNLNNIIRNKKARDKINLQFKAGET